MRSLSRRVLVALGTAFCVATSAAECPEPARFQAQALKVIQREFPGHAVLAGPDDAVEVDGFVFGLENLRKRVCAPDHISPADRELGSWARPVRGVSACCSSASTTATTPLAS